MRLNDFLHPRRVFAAGAKLFVGALALLMVGSVVLQALAGTRASAEDMAAGLIALSAVSVGAYLIRERRMKRRLTDRRTRGAERTPVMEGEE